MSIGELDGDLAYIFGSIRAIALDRIGNVYVMDSQTTDVRAFDSQGNHIRTYGRAGQGPGELTAPDGLAVSPSGRVLVRDPRGGRIQVFEGGGEVAEEWPLLNPNFGTGSPLWVDNLERTYVVTKPRQSDIFASATIMITVARDGTVLDTIPIPTSSFVPTSIEVVATSGSGTSRFSTNVPFTPQAYWAVHPSGSIVLAVSDRYRIHLISESGSVLGIGREYDPIPVATAEREFYEQQVTEQMRRLDPNWRWSGSGLPTMKPPFVDVHVGTDGKLWIQLSNQGEEVSVPINDPDNPDSSPRIFWREPISFDVFEPDGTYLGRVDAPDEFSPFPRPVFDSDGAWGVTYGEFGVPRVTRFDLKTPEAQ